MKKIPSWGFSSVWELCQYYDMDYNSYYYKNKDLRPALDELLQFTRSLEKDYLSSIVPAYKYPYKVTVTKLDKYWYLTAHFHGAPNKDFIARIVEPVEQRSNLLLLL
jgi:hypothetical protein